MTNHRACDHTIGETCELGVNLVRCGSLTQSTKGRRFLSPRKISPCAEMRIRHRRAPDLHQIRRIVLSRLGRVSDRLLAWPKVTRPSMGELRSTCGAVTDLRRTKLQAIRERCASAAHAARSLIGWLAGEGHAVRWSFHIV